MWLRKQKRAYQRAKSGVRVAEYKKQYVKHLVLTSSLEGSKRDIMQDFQVLRKRIEREFNIKFNYFCVHTNEGQHQVVERISKTGKSDFFLLGGVLHIIFRENKFLPWQWLSKNWAEIHKTPNVSIKAVPDRDTARYIVTQYVAGQGSSYQRCSWSQGWVCKGFVKEWKRILHQTSDWKHQRWSQLLQCWCAHHQMEKALDEWDRWLKNLVFKQIQLPLS